MDSVNETDNGIEKSKPVKTVLRKIFNMFTQTSYYTIVGSQQIHPNSVYTVAVNLHDSPEPSLIKVSIKNGDSFKLAKEVLVQPFSTETISFETGPLPQPSGDGYKLVAKGISGLKFRKETQLSLNEKQSTSLIQTDKAMYKPGDKIQFRVILLDRHMAPFVMDGGMNVHVLDGQSNRLKQWTNVAVPNGVFSDELQLSDKPVLGEWTIVVEVLGDIKKKTIEVAEYVLPKVELTIDTRKTITFKDKVRAGIQAKYTYGQPVRGEAKVTLRTQSWHYSSPDELVVQKVIKLHGKEFVEFDMADLKVTRADYRRELTMDAELEEELTGRKYNSSTAIIEVLRSEYHIQNLNNVNEFVPGTPFSVKLRVVRHDGNPIPDTQRSIEVIVKECEEQILSESQTMDVEGSFVFTTILNKVATSYSISVKYLGEIEHVSHLYARSTDAIRRTVLQIKADTPKSILSESIRLDIESPEPMTYFTYQILAGGQVQRSETNKFSTPVSDYSLVFMPTREMLPTAKVVVYYLKAGHLVSSFCEVEITDPENKISLRSSADEAKPSEAIDLIVDAQPGSYVGLLGIDQSVLLLKSGNDLSQSEINDEWNQYGRNYRGSMSDCFRGWCIPPFGRANRDFTTAGAVVLSNLIEPPQDYEMVYLCSAESTLLDSCSRSRDMDMEAYGLGKGEPCVRKDFLQKHGSGNMLILAALLYNRLKKKKVACLVKTAAVISIDSSASQEGSSVRKEFPETWIWDTIADNGSCKQSIGFGNAGALFASAPMAKMRVVQECGVDTIEPPKEVTVRKEFPETWIWDNVGDVSSDGGPLKLTKKVPDTITSWVISAFALNPRTGISLTQDPTKVRVFQPFFVSLNLPYSIKRGEIVTIPVIVFNYMDDDLNAEVTLHNEDHAFEFVDGGLSAKSDLKRSQSVAIKASDGSAISFTINPLKVGPIAIKVTAVSPVSGDGVERILLVEPEGVPRYVNKAFFVDLREKNELESKLVVEIPDTAVPDSTRIEVSAIGDILGSTIKNLDSLIRMPFGCGEQNMLNFVPNIVVINYLNTTKQLNEALKTKALKYMEIGYQRELTYKHNDGSFSAFGESDRNGSTWLTAFVARSFRQAAQHIHIEERIIDDALKWLSTVQTEEGSFPEVGTVCHTDMQGGAGSGIALTAYALIAFVENKVLVSVYKDTIHRAINYIVKKIDSLDDIYSLALAAYALQLTGHTAKDMVLQKFDNKATINENHKFWSKPIVESNSKDRWYSRPSSVNTEMSAYGLLTLIEAKPYVEVIPIMKWLLAQRNDQGGFESTQDTVVGLQALAKIAEKIAVTENALAIKVNYGMNGGESNIKVSKENTLIHQQYELPKDTEEVRIHAKGHGFALVQLSYKYNVIEKDPSPRFTITPTVDSSTPAGLLKLNVATSYISNLSSTQSNMAVMEVEFPSGFTVDQDDISELKASENVKKVETKNGDTIVIVYFDKIGTKAVCPSFTAIRTHEVTKYKPAAITVYDYYDTTRRANTFYCI